MNVQDASRFGAKADPASLVAGYMSGFGNSFESEALAGALPARCA
jgi:homogentisate 1,2-dioxygenase